MNHTADIANLYDVTWTDAWVGAQLYQATGTVFARLVLETTPLTTLVNGVPETTNVAVPGDMLVTGQLGEQWVLSAEVFALRYKPTDVQGLFTATGRVRALQNPTGKPLTINASWGQPQTAAADCWIAEQVDAAGLAASPRYLVANEAFVKKYVAVTL